MEFKIYIIGLLKENYRKKINTKNVFKGDYRILVPRAGSPSQL